VLRTDELDEQIMALLRDDGRLSNREVARRLEISEGTVRQRLKKLEDANAIRMGVVVDLARLGAGFTATVLLTVEPGALEAALDAFARLPSVTYAASVTGQFNALIMMVTLDMSELRALIDAQIAALTGIHRVQVRPMVSTPKHDYHLIAIPRPR
jgi:Lrp/AsnC family transcriptional regulator, regulator for asnA, asnC and gidA